MGTLAATSPRMPATARCKTLSLDARIDDGLHDVQGTLRCKVEGDGLLWFARYPSLLDNQSEVDELSTRREYPDGFDAAALTLQASRAGARVPQAGLEGAWQAFGPVTHGESITVRFTTHVPSRMGTFGSRRGMMTLLGGWHPVVGSGPGFRPELFAAPIRYRVDIPNNFAGFVGVHPFGRTAHRTRKGLHHGTMVPLLVAPALHVHSNHGAVLVAPRSRHGGVHGRGDISAGTDEAAHQETVWTALVGAGFLTEAMAAASPTLTPPAKQGPPLLVVVPLRDRLTEAFEGGVAVSDRAFHLLPLELLKRFHRASLWREQLRAALVPILRRQEPQWPPELLADATAAALTDRLLSATGDMAYAPELLHRFAASPEVDALIYAPQIPFPEVIYNAVDESRQLGRRFDMLLAPLPRGKIIYEKLRDRVGQTEAQRILFAGLSPAALPLLQRIALSAGLLVAEDILQWLGPYPELDYQLGPTESDKNHVRVNVLLDGPDAARICEPVAVDIVDSRGKKHSKVRMGPGPVDFAAPGPARMVEIDPAQRLVEHVHPPRLQPRYNNRTPKRRRLLLNDLSATLDVTGKALSANVDLLGGVIYDLRQDGHLGAFFGPYSFGLQGSAAVHFGGELTPIKLSHTAGLNWAWSRLRGDQEAGATPGQTATIGLAYRYDTRLSRLTALQGTGVDAAVTQGLTHLDGHVGITPWIMVGVSGLKIWPTWRNQALLIRLRADAIIGDAPPQSQLRLGGRYLGARGFQIDDAYGSKRLLSSAEYRHVLVGDSRTDVLGLATLTTVEGALFADAVVMPKLSPGTYGPWLGDVGYGVRVMGDVLGVSPGGLAVDVALPIGRRPQGRIPVTVYLAFVQSFLAF